MMRDICLVGIGLNISFLIQSATFGSAMGVAVSALSMASLGLALYINKTVKAQKGDEQLKSYYLYKAKLETSL